MAFLLIPVILLAVVWLSYVRRRLSELNENVNTAMNQIGLQLSSRFRALEALLELARTTAFRPSWCCCHPPSMPCPHRRRCWNRSSILHRPCPTSPLRPRATLP